MPPFALRPLLAGLALLLPFVVWAYGGLWEYLNNQNLACISLAFVALLYCKRDFSLRDALAPGLLLFFALALLQASPVDQFWQLLFIFFTAFGLFSDRTRGLRPVFGRVLLAACLVNALISLLQYFDLAWVGGPLFFQSPPGVIVGNLRQTNNLSTLMVIGLVLLAEMDEAPTEESRWRGALMGAGLIFGVIVALTGSRTGLLAILAVCGAGFYLLRRKKVLLAGLCGNLLGNLWLTLDSGNSALLRLVVDKSLPCAGRRAIWRDGLEIIQEKPWTGWGWEGLRYAQAVLGGEGKLHSCALLGKLHNEPLQVAATFGIPALCLFLLLLLVWSAIVFRRYCPEKAVYILLLLPLLLHSLLEYPLHRPFFLLVLAFAIAGLMALDAPRSEQRRPWPGGHLLPVVFWLLVMAFFSAAEMSSRTIAEKNNARDAHTVTAMEHFFRPREAFFLTLYYAPLDFVSKDLLEHEAMLLKTVLNVEALEKLRDAAEMSGDSEKTARFKRMIAYETDRLRLAGGGGQ